MAGIFISYRRDDTSGYAGRLASDLRHHFDQGSIFHDIEQIDPGADFVDVIQQALDKCAVLLAVMGPHWVEATDKRGRRRLDNPDDFVFIEIHTALNRKIRVIPVLVGSCEMPDSEQLPDPIKPLARRQAHELSDTRWRFDVEKLAEKIKLAISAEARPAGSPETTMPVKLPDGSSERTGGQSDPTQSVTQRNAPQSAERRSERSSTNTQPDKEGDRGPARTKPLPKLQWVSPKAVAIVVLFGMIGVLGFYAFGPSPTKLGAASPGGGSTVVKIGHAAPLTGGIAHLGKDNENGVRLAVDEANAKGMMIGGQKVVFEMLSEDDEARPDKGPIIAQKLVDAKVAGVVGHLNSGVTIPASAIYNQAGIPMITGSATNPRLTEQGFRVTFRTVGRDDQQGPAIARYLASQYHPKTVAIIDDATPYGEGLANGVEEALRAASVTVLPREKGTDRTNDWKTILTKLRRSKPDAIFYGGMDSGAGPLMRQARELGIQAMFAFGDGACTEKMKELAGDAADGFICSQMGIPVQQASKTFLDAYRAKFNSDPLIYAPFTYDAANLLMTSMQKADSVDPARYLPELAKISYLGATGKIEFDAKGDRKAAEVTVFTLTGGRIEPLAIIRER